MRLFNEDIAAREIFEHQNFYNIVPVFGGLHEIVWNMMVCSLLALLFGVILITISGGGDDMPAELGGTECGEDGGVVVNVGGGGGGKLKWGG